MWSPRSKMRFTSVIEETAEDASFDQQVLLRLIDQETVQVNNHYEVLLPLKSTDVTKRINCLRKRFIRYKLFYKMYKAFIGDMFEKGYVRKAENAQVAEVLFIPHHSHAPNKAMKDKICL